MLLAITTPAYIILLILHSLIAINKSTIASTVTLQNQRAIINKTILTIRLPPLGWDTDEYLLIYSLTDLWNFEFS